MKTIHYRWRGALGIAVFSIVAFFYAPVTFASIAWQDVRSSVPMLGLATDGHSYVAVGFNGLWSSTNLKSWQKVSLPAGAGTSFRDVIWDSGQGQFIAVGTSILTSSDGAAWTMRVKPSATTLWNAIAVSGGVYLVVGSDATHVERSTDGAHWASVSTGLSIPSPDLSNFTGIASNGSGFVSLGYEYTQDASGDTFPQADIVATASADGLTWTLGTLPSSGADEINGFLQDVAWGNSTYIAGGFAGVYTSPDGITWSEADPSIGTKHPLMERLAYLNGNFIGVGLDNDNGTGGSQQAAVFTSADGVHWTIDDLEPSAASSLGAAAILYTGSKYVEGGEQGVYTSADASTWTKIYTGPQNYLGGCIIDSGSRFSIPGLRGTLYSDDGVTWSETTSGQPALILVPTYGEGCGAFGAGTYVAAGGGTYISSDGKSWTANGPSNLAGVAWNGSEFVDEWSNGGSTGAGSETSSDGKTWGSGGAIFSTGTVAFGNGSPDSTGLAYLNGNWVAWGLHNSAPFVAVSTDAKHWTATTSGLPANGTLAGIAYGNGVYVAIGDDISGKTVIFTSTNAKSWTQVTGLKSGTGARWQTLIYGNAEFLAGGVDNTADSAAFLQSTDGKHWTYDTDSDTSEIYGIDWDGSKYVAVSFYDILDYTPPASSGSGSSGGSTGGGTGGGSSAGSSSGGGGGEFDLLCFLTLVGLLLNRRFRI